MVADGWKLAGCEGLARPLFSLPFETRLFDALSLTCLVDFEVLFEMVLVSLTDLFTVSVL